MRELSIAFSLLQDGTLAWGQHGHDTEVGKEIESNTSRRVSWVIGYADYVLWDDNGNPLAVIEAKKTSVDPERGRQQAKLVRRWA